MLTIDGLTLAAPAVLQIGYESVGRTEITADGCLAADRLALKRRVKIVWNGLKPAEAAQVLTALTQGVFLAVTLPDPVSADAVTLTMALASLEAGLLTAGANGKPGICREITAVLRER